MAGKISGFKKIFVRLKGGFLKFGELKKLGRSYGHFPLSPQNGLWTERVNQIAKIWTMFLILVEVGKISLRKFSL